MCLSIKVYRRCFISILLYHLKYAGQCAIQSFGPEVGLLKYVNFLGECYLSSNYDPDWECCSWKKWFTMTRDASWTVMSGLIMWGRNQGYLCPGNRWHSNSTMQIHIPLMKEMHSGDYKVKPFTFEVKLLAEFLIIWFVIPNICCLCCYTT